MSNHSQMKPSPAAPRVQEGGVPEPFVLLTSQNDTFLLPLIVPLLSIEGQSSFGGLSEDVLHVLLVLRRTLEVELCIHLLPGLLALHPKPTLTLRISLFGSDIKVIRRESVIALKL